MFLKFAKARRCYSGTHSASNFQEAELAISPSLAVLAEPSAARTFPCTGLTSRRHHRLSHHTYLSASNALTTTRHDEAFHVPTHAHHTTTVYSYLQHTAGTSLAAKSASPAVLCRVLRDFTAHYARLPVANTHCCCSSQREKEERRGRYSKWPRKTSEYHFSNALPCFGRVTHTGEKSSRPLFLLLCIASALIGGRSSCAYSHLVSAAAAEPPCARTVPSRCPDVTAESHAH